MMTLSSDSLSLLHSHRTHRSITFDDAVAALLCVFVFAIPTELTFNQQVSVTLPAGALAIIVGLIGIIWHNRIVVPTFGIVLLSAFVIWATISIAWSPFPGSSLARVSIYWEYLIMSAVMTQYLPLGNIRTNLFKAYIAGCTWGIFDITSRYLSGSRYDGMDGRFSAANTDPNYLALALVIGIPIACYLAFHAHPAWTRILYVLYVPAALFGVVLTGSRGAVMSIGAVAIAVCISGKGKTQIFCCIALTLIALGFVLPMHPVRAAAELLPSEAAKRFTGIGQELESGSLANRREFWKIGVELLAQHAIRGNGAAVGDELLSTVRGRTKGLHSLPLQLATDEGLIGCVLFYGALLISIQYVWRWPVGLRTAMLGAAAAWIVGSCSLNWDIHKATWMLLTLFISARSLPSVACEDVVPASTRKRQFVCGVILN